MTPYPIVVSSCLYVAPKVLSYLGTEKKSPSNYLDILKNKIAIIPQEGKIILGNRAYHILTNVIADNAWLAFLAIYYGPQRAPFFVNFDQALATTGTFAGVCAVAFSIRKVTAFIFPKLEPLIGPKKEG